MSDVRQSAQPVGDKVLRRRLAAAFCLSTLLGSGLSSCAPRYVEETVTTDASRSSALPGGAEPIAIEPKLPARDVDLEAAGDRIAEAITDLHARRREAALRALNESEAALNRVFHARAGDDQVRAALRQSLKDLDGAERAIQKGAPDAAHQLVALNKAIDNLPLQNSNK